MTQEAGTKIRLSFTAGALLTMALATIAPASAYDPKQSTGPGTVQGKDGSITTPRGGNTGEHTGRNDQSGSGTGAVRDPHQAEPPAARDGKSQPAGSDSTKDSHKGGTTGKTGADKGN